MKNEVTNEQILKAMNAGFARVDEQFGRVQKQFDHVEEQFEELALMTKVQFDEVDRKLSILGARTRGFGLWP